MRTRADLLHAAAIELDRDLGRMSTGRWGVVLSGDQILQILHDGVVVGRQPVVAEFDPDRWPDEALGPKWLDATHADDAVESVADACAAARSAFGLPWPHCPKHPADALMVCSSTWTCPRTHDIAPVGELRVGQANPNSGGSTSTTTAAHPPKAGR